MKADAAAEGISERVTHDRNLVCKRLQTRQLNGANSKNSNAMLCQELPGMTADVAAERVPERTW